MKTPSFLALDSLRYIRAKVYGHRLSEEEIRLIVNDIAAGKLSEIPIAMFLTACVGSGLNETETLYLTRAMIDSGKTISWPNKLVVDKHCIGGIPGNRTTLIVVPIVAAFGLLIPKTSSRAITSPAGTADTMEVFAPVNLDLTAMRRVVEQESGCIIWGGSASLSPADDILIRVERVMDIDSEGQMVASILSKKISAGSTHLVIDIPIGPTAQESRDVMAVLSNDITAPEDLRDHALTLAGMILEFSPDVAVGTGKMMAENLLTSGTALKKFEAICRAQGGFFDIPKATYTHTITAPHAGTIAAINNRYLAQLAKLAGAPNSKAAGVEILVKLGVCVSKDQPVIIIHAETHASLNTALSFIDQGHEIIVVSN